MENLNNTTDLAKYLESGKRTQPFLDTEYVREQAQKHCKKGEPLYMGLAKWIRSESFIRSNFAINFNKKYISETKFTRNADEIWQNKVMTGCTDYALVYATLARQLGIPATFLATSEKGWVEETKVGNKPNLTRGHAFCEIFDTEKQKWVLMDPTFAKVEENYDVSGFKMGFFHRVKGKREFIPYCRSLDIGEIRSAEDYITIQRKSVFEPVDFNYSESQKPSISKLDKTTLEEISGLNQEELQKTEEFKNQKKSPNIEQSQDTPSSEPTND